MCVCDLSSDLRLFQLTLVLDSNLCYKLKARSRQLFVFMINITCHILAVSVWCRLAGVGLMCQTRACISHNARWHFVARFRQISEFHRTTVILSSSKVVIYLSNHPDSLDR